MTPDDGKYGILLIVGNAGCISTTVEQMFEHLKIVRGVLMLHTGNYVVGFRK